MHYAPLPDKGLAIVQVNSPTTPAGPWHTASSPPSFNIEHYREITRANRDNSTVGRIGEPCLDHPLARTVRINAMIQGDIDELVTHYVQTVCEALNTGFDGVELNAGKRR